MTGMMDRREVNRILALAAGGMIAGASGILAPAANASKAQTPQNGVAHANMSIGVKNLLSEPLAKMENPEVRMLTLMVAPGATSHAHRHTGPVFAYILEGAIENQVDPEQPKEYKAGDFFYEPPMHVHRELKNLSATQPAKILIVEIGEKGQTFTIDAQ
ncbi:MAG TPA: cupin domain-containing protein [Verrucomicrobiae bacterium]|nr:cupin domain-containing protein [Verrucomicrobiae bacterium]